MFRRELATTCLFENQAFAGLLRCAGRESAIGTQQQETQFCGKNAGLFFLGTVPQAWVTSGVTTTTAMAAHFFEQTFMCGKNQWPGACEPVYSFRWCMAATMGQYPEMDIDPKTGKTGLAMPVGIGFSKLIYTTIYDHELTILDTTHVKEN